MGPNDDFVEEVKLLGCDPWRMSPNEVVHIKAGMLAGMLVMLAAKCQIEGEKKAFEHASIIANDVARRRREMIFAN